jgi:hypothetical protein
MKLFRDSREDAFMRATRHVGASDSRVGRLRVRVPATVLLMTAMAIGTASADIRFDRGAAFAIGREPAAVALADIDGNGVPDILALSRADDRLALFLGRIDARTRDWFGTPVDESTGRGDESGGGYGRPRPPTDPVDEPLPGFSTGPIPVDIAIADLNEDGVPDVAIAERGLSFIGIRTGSRSGTLSPRFAFRLPDRPVRLHAADVDGDGLVDLVVVCDRGVYLAHGSRTALIGRIEQLAVPILGTAVASDVADADGDGFLDVAVLSMAEGQPVTLGIVHGDGAGWFGRALGVEFDSRLFAVNDLRVVDLDRDGLPELIAASADSGLFVRTEGASVARLYAANGIAGSIATADFDRDGFSDLLTASGGGGGENSFSVHIADGRGGLESPVRFQSGGAVARVALGDLDNDRVQDVILPTAGFEADEPGTFDLFFDRSLLSLGAGSVNAGAGTIVDVLFVNDSTGGVARQITLARGAPLSIYVDSPPAARTPAPFALLVWTASPTRGSGYEQPFGIGRTALPTPLSGGSPQPVFAWNGTGRDSLGSAPCVPCGPAPREVLRRPLGVARPVMIYLQGFIADPASAGEKPASVTNGILVDIR